MDKKIKTVLIMSTIGIVIFSITFIIGKVGRFDLRILGVIFLGTQLSYCLGLLYKYKRQ